MRYGAACVIGVLLVVSPLVVQAASRSGPVYRLTLENPPEQQEVSLWDKILRAFRLAPVRIITPKPGQVFSVTAVAYSSTPDQTYGDPCITAMGTRVREGVVATNFLPLGTRLLIEDKEFVVEDRMHSRYDGKYIIDIWHPTREQAILFGRKQLRIEVLPTKGAVELEDEEEPSDEIDEEFHGEEEELTTDEDSPEPILGIIVETVRRGFSLFSRFITIRVLPADVEC